MGAGEAIKAETATPEQLAAAGAEQAAAVLQDRKHTAANFDAEEVPFNTFVWNGQDYKEMRAQASMRVRLRLCL